MISFNDNVKYIEKILTKFLSAQTGVFYLRIMICDDNAVFLQNLSQVVTDYFIEKNIDIQLKSFCKSTDALEDSTSYDIAFLDIKMPEHNGFDVAKHLQNINPNIIIFIITSHEHYLDQAMDLRVFRFLPKPIDKERIFSGLDSAIKYYIKNTSFVLLENSTAHRIFIKDILYITIQKRKTLLVTKYSEIKSDKTLSEWEKVFDNMCFGRPHYSYLVNLHNIVRLDKDEVVLLKNDGCEVSIKISQRRFKKFKEKFIDCFSSELD